MPLLTVFFALAMGGVLIYIFVDRGKRETNLEPPDKMCYTAVFDPLILPIFLAVLFLMILFVPLFRNIWEVWAGWFIILILLISVYYAVLLCLLPLLRRIFSPRACAAFWILPNSLYLLINFRRNLYTGRPLFVLTVPKSWLGVLGILWAVGFVLVMLRQIVSHLRYRRLLLRDASTDPICAATNQWRQEQHRMGVKRQIPLVVSGHTSTPLTIGCYERTFRLVLPHLDYTEDELRLIYRHELRHIQRVDSRTKFFLGFCTALCWFNPLMWIARRKVSDDLELSCDELVLTYENEQTRRQYAHLLLNTAGSGKGYTTCLSAAAATMRYRLKHIVKPRKLLSGSIAVGVTLALLILGSGVFALSDSPGTVGEKVFARFPEGSTLKDPYAGSARIRILDGEALFEYISSLTVREIYTDMNRTYSSSEDLYLGYFFPDEDGEGAKYSSLRLWDGVLFMDFPFDDRGDIAYELLDEVDWEYVYSLVEFETEE